MQKKILGLAMAGLLLSGCSVKTAITTTAETTTAPTTTATTTVTETTTTATETTTTTPVTTTAAYEVMDHDFSAVTLAAQEAAEGQEDVYHDYVVDRAFGFILTDSFGSVLFSGVINSVE